MQTVREELMGLMVRKTAQLQDLALKEALGKWVSEIEPEIVTNGRGVILGIGAIGHSNPIIPVRGVDVHFTYEGRRV